MSSQNTLITCANDNEIKRPSGTLISRQLYRDKSPQGSGVYKAMDENGSIEIIGGPGASVSLFSDQAQATDDITTSSIVDVVATGMALKPPAGTYLVWFSGSVKMDSNETESDLIFSSIYLNETQIQSSEQTSSALSTGRSTTVGTNFPFNGVARVTVDGTQTIQGKWRVGLGTSAGTMHQRNLTILKIS